MCLKINSNEKKFKNIERNIVKVLHSKANTILMHGSWEESSTESQATIHSVYSSRIKGPLAKKLKVPLAHEMAHCGSGGLFFFHYSNPLFPVLTSLTYLHKFFVLFCFLKLSHPPLQLSHSPLHVRVFYKYSLTTYVGVYPIRVVICSFF